MKRVISVLSASLILSFLSGCGNNQISTIQDNQIISAANNSNLIDNKSFGEQQRQQSKLHDFYFKYYAGSEDHYNISDSKNEHLNLLLKAEKRIDSADALLDSNNDSKVTWEEVKKFITGKLYIADFRKNIATFSFGKLDKSNNKSLDAKEFGTFNKEIKAKEVADFKLNEELKAFDYNNDTNLAIEEYEDFFIKYLLKKIVWRA